MCAAPKGNKYYLLAENPGRPKLFPTPEDFWKAFCEYRLWANQHPWYKNEAIKGGDLAGEIVSIPIERPLTLGGFAVYIGCGINTIQRYGRDEEYKEFFTVFTRVENETRSQKFEGAAVGTFNANIIARDLGLVDKKELKGDNNNPLIVFKDFKNDRDSDKV